MSVDLRRVWLTDHLGEMTRVIREVRAQGQTRSQLTDEVVTRVMAMNPPPPGGEETAVFIAQILWATTVPIKVPDSIPNWMSPGRSASGD